MKMNVEDDKDGIVDGVDDGKDLDDKGVGVKLEEDAESEQESTDGDEDDEHEEEDEEEEDEGEEITNEDELEEEDEADEDEDGEEIGVEGLRPTSPDSKDANQCPICLNGLNLGQDIGAPITCVSTHLFCFDCLEEWSKNVNTCPVDRKEFNLIIVTKGINGPIVDKIEITNRSFSVDEPQTDSNFDDVTYCEICGRCDREDRLLLCDNCDFGYHCECLDPPLEVIPIEEWYCPDCHRTLFGSDSDEQGPNYLQEINRYNRRLGRRVIARTRASELVRNRVERRRVADNSDLEFEPVRRTTPSAPRRRRVVKRRRKRRTRKTTTSSKKTSSRTCKSTTKRKTTRRKRRKATSKAKGRSRRSRAASRPLAAPTPRSRICSKLGLERITKLGVHSLPTRKIIPGENLSMRRSAAGIGQLSIFGSELSFHGSVPLREDFIDFPDLPHGGSPDSSDVLTRVRRSLTSIPNIRNRTKQILLNPPITSQISSCDLLGDILENQKVLLTSARDVIINRDGTLRLKESPNTIVSSRNCTGGGGSSGGENGPPNHSSRSPDSTSQNESRGSSSPFRPTTSTGLCNNTSPLPRDVHGEPDFVIQKPVPTFAQGVKKTSKKNSSKKDNELDEAFLTETDEKMTSDNADESLGEVDIYSDIESVGESDTNVASNGMNIAAIDDAIIKPIGKPPSEHSDASDEDNLVIDEHNENPKLDKTSKEKKIQDEIKRDVQLDQNNIHDEEQVTTGNNEGDEAKDKIHNGEEKPDSESSEKPPEEVHLGNPNISNAQLLTANASSPIDLSSNHQNVSESIQEKPEEQPKLYSDEEAEDDLKPKVIGNSGPLSSNKEETLEGPVLPNGHFNVEIDDKKESLSETIEENGSEKKSLMSSISATILDEDAYGPNLPPGGILQSPEAPSDKLSMEAMPQKQSDLTKIDIIRAKKSHEMEEGEIPEPEAKIEVGKDGAPKVRRCKHGKLIHSKKKQEDKPRSGSKERKDISSKPQVVQPVQNELKISAEKTHLMSHDKDIMDDKKPSTRDSDDVWKKLSHTSKLRSYRDGKPKDPEVLFRECSRSAKKESRHRSYDKSKDERGGKDVARSSRKRDDHDRRRSRSPGERISKHHEDERNHLRDERLSSSKKRARASPSRDNSPLSSRVLEKASNQRPRDSTSSPVRRESRRTSPYRETYGSKLVTESKRKYEHQDNDEDKTKVTKKKKRKYSKHKHRKSDEIEQNEDKKYYPDLHEPSDSTGKRSVSGSRHHKHHKKSKHRHHSREGRSHSPIDHKSPTRIEEDKKEKTSIRTKSNKRSRLTSGENEPPDRNKRDQNEKHCKTSKTPANVNLTQEPNEDGRSENEIDGGGDRIGRLSSAELKSGHSKPGSPPKKDVRLVSKSRTEFDIFWDENSPTKKLEGGIHLSEKSEREKASNATGVVQEDTGLRFLPRTLLSDATSPVVCLPQTAGPKTPPDEERMGKDTPLSSPDQTMPTPTQDESLEGDYSNDSGNMQRSSIKSLNSPSDGQIPDMYDPEAPLESPEDDQLLKSAANRPHSKLNETPKRSPIKEKQSSPTKSIPRPETPVMGVPSPRSPSPFNKQPHKFKSPSNCFKPSSTPSKVSSSLTTTINRIAPKAALTSLDSSIPPAPGSLLAQIHQTLNLQNKALPNFSETQKQSQSHQSIGSSSGYPSSSALPVHGKSNTPLSSIGAAPGTNSLPFGANKNQSNDVVDMDVESPLSSATNNVAISDNQKDKGPLPLSNLTSLNTMSPSLKSLLENLIKAAQQQQSKSKTSKGRISGAPSNVNSIFKKPAPVLGKEPSPQCKKSQPPQSSSSKTRPGHHSHHHSIKTTVVDKGSAGKKALSTQGSASGSAPNPLTKLSDVAVLDDVPSSAVELQVKEKYLKKLNRQERVIEEVKMVLKPFYQRKEITKDEYKEIMRKAVPKICHSKTGEINPQKVRLLVEGYVQRFKHARKKAKTAKSK